MIKLPIPLLKKLILGAVVICPTLVAGNALLHLRNNYYLAGAGDIAWHNNIKFEPAGGGFTEQHYDPGVGISVAVGRACGHWRAELEGAYRQCNMEKIFGQVAGIDFSEDATGFVRDFALMANAYWDVYIPCSWWIFYIGGGLGVSFQKREACSSSTQLEEASNTLFAWQGMAGFAYEIIDRVFLNLGYRIFMTTKPRSPTEKADDIVIVNNLELGVRIEL